MRKACCDKQGNNKGAWSKQEDQNLIHYIRTHGEGAWRSLPKDAGLRRCGKRCRLSWINYLRPDIKRGNFGQDEEDLIIKLHALLGNRWSLIAGRLPGRTDNEVKNYWNSHIKKKLLKMGIDPNNHKISTKTLAPIHQNYATSNNNDVDACANNKKDVGRDKVDVVSSDDTRSCLEDETNLWSSSSHIADAAKTGGQLNLDLTISFPYSSCSQITKNENRVCIDNPPVINCRDIVVDMGASTATLLLFP